MREVHSYSIYIWPVQSCCSVWPVQTCCSSMDSQMILRDVCGASFTKNKSRLRHVRTVHQGKKRADNEKRKREVTEKVRKQGHLACTDIRTCEIPAGPYSKTCEAQVESVPRRGLAHLWEPGLEMQACQDFP